MSRVIVDRSLRSCRTLASWLADPVGVDAVFGDVLPVGGENADVAVVDEHEDVLSFVGASDAGVAEFAGVAHGHFAGRALSARRADMAKKTQTKGRIDTPKKTIEPKKMATRSPQVGSN
jgi:hypothetical protein